MKHLIKNEECRMKNEECRMKNKIYLNLNTLATELKVLHSERSDNSFFISAKPSFFI